MERDCIQKFYKHHTCIHTYKTHHNNTPCAKRSTVPEYISRVLAPSKPFLGFVSAAAGCFDQVKNMSQQNEMDWANGVGIIV
ncbi:unnamed protein product [Penicillium camemberti]|uniref:Str. FM013 n=1 Tax=Penicillium camemberti (strain FM 013) TaxID=1429867 RepID=A0A0G4PGS2_PENC3|nr:unnamed protein product [Penicillium camemberti]